MPVVGVGVWQTAVPARDDLGFVDVDEDLGMSGWASATVADGHALVDEADGLLVDELDGGVGARLRLQHRLLKPRPRHRHLPRVLRCAPRHCPVRRLHRPRALHSLRLLNLDVCLRRGGV